MQIESLEISGNNISRVVVTDSNMDTASTEVRDGESDWHEVKININLLRNLRHINLSHNRFYSFPSELSNGRALEFLDLSFNKINKINRTLKMKMLTGLNLQNNKLVKLEKSTFESYPNLQTLDLSGNRLTTLKDFKLTKGKMLNVSNNQISKVETNTFKECEQLETLDLSHNLQMQIMRSTFDGLQSSLRELDLSSNKLTQIRSDAFSELEQLHSLNLSRNTDLKKINHIIFPYHLKTLELNDISLQEIDECSFQHLKDIKKLNLGSNNLSCSCHIYWMSKSFESMYINENITCRNFTDNTDVPIRSLRLECLKHNCKIHSMKSWLNLTIDVIDRNLEIKWRSSFATYRFLLQVTDSSKETELLQYIDYDYEYKFESSSSFASYNVCISAVNENKEIIQKVCDIAYVSDKSIIIGISAGVLALCPCIVLLIYIVCKDKKYKMKLLAEAQEDKLPIVKQATNSDEIKHEQHNKAFEHENIQDKPNIVIQADISPSKDPQNAKTQLSSSTKL